MSLEAEPPQPTGKPPEDITLAGTYVPWDGDGPALLGMPGTDAKYIACFSDPQALREVMAQAGCQFTKVKRVDDGQEFLLSLPETIGGAPLHVALDLRFTPAGKVRFKQVARDPEAVKKAELRTLVKRMRSVCSKTYNLFFVAGMGGDAHAFLEFCGVLSKYVDICERCAEQGIDFRMLNTHSGRGLPVETHDMAYLGEKLDCIFGPAIRSNPEAREVLKQALFGNEEQP